MRVDDRRAFETQRELLSGSRRRMNHPLMNAHQLHKQACERGEPSYIDPGTGLMVFTAVGLRRRGDCCGTACRHCPFDYANVPEPARGDLLRARTQGGHSG